MPFQTLFCLLLWKKLVSLSLGKRGDPLWKLRTGKRNNSDKRRQNALWKLRGGKRSDDMYKREALWKLRAGKRANMWKFRTGKRSLDNWNFFIFLSFSLSVKGWIVFFWLVVFWKRKISTFFSKICHSNISQTKKKNPKWNVPYNLCKSKRDHWPPPPLKTRKRQRNKWEKS